MDIDKTATSPAGPAGRGSSVCGFAGCTVKQRLLVHGNWEPLPFLGTGLHKEDCLSEFKYRMQGTAE